MRCLWRNKRKFYYTHYLGKVMSVDSEGFETGEYITQYSEPVMMWGNVSAAIGEAQEQQFGRQLNYDKVLLLEDENCPIDENTLLYIDVVPAEGVKPDYIIKKVARSLHGVSYAISKVSTS